MTADPDLPTTIPATLSRAVERYGSSEALVDEIAPPRLPLARGPRRRGHAWSHRVRHRARRPGRHLGPEHRRVGHRRARACTRPARRWSPLNTRFKGARGRVHPRQVRRPHAVHRHRLPRHRLRRPCCARPACPTRSRRSSCSAATCRTDTHAWARLRSTGAERHRGRCSRASAPRHRARRPLRHPLHLGHHRAPKGAMLPHGASVRAYDAWADVVGLRQGDRYLIVNPFFHAFGLKAGILACLIKGATIIPHPVFDVPSVMRRVAEERVTMLPGPAGDLPDDPRPPRPRRRSTCRRCGSRSPAPAPVPVEMIRRMREELAFETIVTGYGLTEAHGIATMCRHDDDPETIANTAGPRDPRHRGARRRRRRQRRRRPASPARCVVRGYNVMTGLLRRPRGHRRGDRRRRLAAHRRHRRASTSAATSRSPTARRTCSSSAGSTPTRPRSRTS